MTLIRQPGKTLIDPWRPVLKVSHSSSHSKFPGGPIENGVCGMVTPELCTTGTAVLYMKALGFFLCAPPKYCLSLGDTMSSFSSSSSNKL